MFKLLLWTEEPHGLQSRGHEEPETTEHARRVQACLLGFNVVWKLVSPRFGFSGSSSLLLGSPVEASRLGWLLLAARGKAPSAVCTALSLWAVSRQRGKTASLLACPQEPTKCFWWSAASEASSLPSMWWRSTTPRRRSGAFCQ